MEERLTRSGEKYVRWLERRKRREERRESSRDAREIERKPLSWKPFERLGL